MKFSDMMGKGESDATTEVAEVEPPADTRFVPPPPLDATTAPPVPGADIRFGGVPAAPVPAPPAPPVAAPAPAVAAPRLSPSISDVVAELAPRATSATDQQLDTSSWLDGINEIDDDLLPK